MARTEGALRHDALGRARSFSAKTSPKEVWSGAAERGRMVSVEERGEDVEGEATRRFGCL